MLSVMDEEVAATVPGRRLVIFDFDGTLGDSMWVWESVIAEFFAARGVEPEHDAMAQLAQLGMVAGAQNFLQHYRLNESPEQVCSCWLAAAREKYATAVKLKPGARAFLLRGQAGACACAGSSA